MYLKITNREGRKIVAACDRELIGKVLEDGEQVLDLEKYSSFYRGEEANSEEVKAALKGFDSANLVGKKAVGVALELGIVQKRDVRYIKGVPHLQIYKL